MGGAGFVMAVWMQETGTLPAGDTHLLLTVLTVFVGLVALAMLTQAVVVLAVGIGLFKAQKKITVLAQQLQAKAIPVIQNAESLVRETIPKVRTVTDNVVETSHIVRSKAQDFEVTLADANLKTKAQVARVDSLLTTALGRTAAIADTIHNGINTPVKQVAGVVNGLKVGFDVLLSKTKPTNGYRSKGL